MTNKYDTSFRLYSAVYFGGLVAWPWLKALGIVESGLRQDAVSPRGALGIMQLMPGTIKDHARELHLVPDETDPDLNIMLGVRHLRKQWNIFQQETGLERLRFAIGAYNAGPGHIIEAQKLTGRPNIWESVSGVLHHVTGDDNALETINHVRKVEAARLAIIDE